MILKTEYTVAGIIIALLVGAGAGYIYCQSPLERYKSRAEFLEAKNLDLQSHWEQLNEEYTDLRDQLEVVTENLSSTQSSFQDLKKSYEELKEKHELEKEEIVGLREQLETLNETYQYILKHSAVFVISELVFNSSEVESGYPVKTSVTVKNIGSLKGTNPIELKIDGVTEATKEVTLLGGEAKTIFFDMIKNEIKTYNVTVNGFFGTFKVIRPVWCKIGVPYIAGDGLTVTLHSLTITEKIGSYQYTIWYTLENKQKDKSIYEGTFKMNYANESGSLSQYGFFGELFPGDTITRAYTFEELKNKPFYSLEYHAPFQIEEPLEYSLKWKVELP